ncbi:MAG: beta strand repeat-containing protein [Smithella sp.]
MTKLINAKLLRSLSLLISFIALCCLIACGGSKSSSSSSSTGSNTTTTTQGFLSLTFTYDGSSTNSVTFGFPVTATATLTDASGNAVSGAVVTFAAADTSLVTLSPASTALTNSSGVASISIDAANSTSAGATSITASAPITSGGTTTTINSTALGITVNGATLTLGAITLGQPQIYAYGFTSVSVPVFVDSAAANVPISVTFSSNCTALGKATIPSSISIGGIAASVYIDNGCGSSTNPITTDTIVASVTGASAMTTINIVSQISLNLSSNVLSYGTPVTATATVRNSSGTLVNGAIVTFAVTDSSLVTFTPTTGTALTNSSGVATIQLNTAGISSSGATSITASATVGGITSTSTAVGISVGGATVSLGTMALGSPTISAYGTSSVTVPVLINSAPATIPISVTFVSPCVSSGKATITTPVTSNASTGNAISTYKDNGCGSGTDTITATATGSSNSSSAVITVTPPTTNNIQFISATPSIIGTSTEGSESLPQTSLVKFQVLDINNNGKAGVLVDFTLMPSSAPGGVALSATSSTSDASGYVTVSVNSGTVPTPIWVVATVDGTSIKTQSNILTITTGLPTQNFFSISASTHNIEGWIYDGITSTLTIIASDRMGNPVPDGTAINFHTEGGQIGSGTSGTCATTGGTCAVTFKSSEYRPRNETPGVEATYWNGLTWAPMLYDGVNIYYVVNGRVTLVAFALGEESFIDANGNNSYDSGETFYDLGDVYIDANENGQWDLGETYWSQGLGTSACLTQPAGTPLPSYYSDVPSKQNTCSGKWDANSSGGAIINYVRRSTVMTLSGSSAQISDGNTVGSGIAVSMGGVCVNSFLLWLMDENGNPMPAGTTIATANNYIYYEPATTGTPTETLASPSITAGSPVTDSNHAGGTAIVITVAADCTAGTPAAYPSGSVDLVVTTPKAIVSSIGITVN